MSAFRSISITIAIMGVVGMFVVPEVRCAVGLERCSPSSTTAGGVADEGQPATAQTQQPGTLRLIQITDPPKETPPHGVLNVISVSGSGDIPSGRHLWIFVYGSGVNRYYPQAEVDPQSKNSWTVLGVNIGASTENTGKFTIYALLIDDSTNTQVSAFAGGHPEGYSEEEWKTSFQQLAVDKVEVKRI